MKSHITNIEYVLFSEFTEPKYTKCVIDS